MLVWFENINYNSSTIIFMQSRKSSYIGAEAVGEILFSVSDIWLLRHHFQTSTYFIGNMPFTILRLHLKIISSFKLRLKLWQRPSMQSKSIYLRSPNLLYHLYIHGYWLRETLHSLIGKRHVKNK